MLDILIRSDRRSTIFSYFPPHRVEQISCGVGAGGYCLRYFSLLHTLFMEDWKLLEWCPILDKDRGSLEGLFILGETRKMVFSLEGNKAHALAFV